jgi:hypothetical protein
MLRFNFLNSFLAQRTSVTAPFVTGAFALLWSLFPVASAAELLLAVRGTRRPTRVGIVPPLLVHRLAYNGDVVAFKMGRRQSAPQRR